MGCDKQQGNAIQDANRAFGKDENLLLTFTQDLLYRLAQRATAYEDNYKSNSANRFRSKLHFPLTNLKQARRF